MTCILRILDDAVLNLPLPPGIFQSLPSGAVKIPLQLTMPNQDKSECVNMSSEAMKIGQIMY